MLPGRRSSPLEYVHVSGVDGLSATTGHDGGGTAVRVHSLGLQASGAGLGCRFGSVGPVEATLVQEGEALCVSPAHREGAVPVDLTVNARDYTTSETSFVFADYACKEMYEASPRQIFVGVPSSVSVGVVGSSIRLFTHGSVNSDLSQRAAAALKGDVVEQVGLESDHARESHHHVVPHGRSRPQRGEGRHRNVPQQQLAQEQRH